MKDQVNNIERKIDTLYDAFIGSELQPNGYVKRLEKIEKHQETDKRQKWMFAGGVAVLGFLFNLWGKL
tara:strand:+ start:1347 stop:1550 length:204 start_codon:yes stop_codon:yes gene_type:complete